MKQWTAGEVFEGVTEVWTAEGSVYGLEVQKQSEGNVVGTVWRTIHATYEEPADVECVLEKEYATIGEATRDLEKIDEDEVKYQQAVDYSIDQSRREALL
jgi:hypothetical protein